MLAVLRSREPCDERAGPDREGPARSPLSYHLLMDAFEGVCEIEPATRPDLKKVRHQIGVLSTTSATSVILG